MVLVMVLYDPMIIYRYIPEYKISNELKKKPSEFDDNTTQI